MPLGDAPLGACSTTKQEIKTMTSPCVCFGIYKFYSIESMLAYNKKYLHQRAKEMANSPNHFWDYEGALAELKGCNYSVWNNRTILFSEHSCDNLIEIQGRQLFLGCPAHLYWWTFDSQLEAIKEGFSMAKLAVSLGISLDDFRRETIEKLHDAYASKVTAPA